MYIIDDYDIINMTNEREVHAYEIEEQLDV